MLEVPLTVLVGTRVDLRAIEPTDYARLARWLNDPDLMLYWGHPGQTLSVPEVQHTEELNSARGTSHKYIVQTKDGEPIGQIDYYDLDWRTRACSVSIMIGEPDFIGGGYGTDAMRTLLGYLFRQLGLHRVSLNVHASNERAQRSYQKNGFVKEGILRDWAYFNGNWEDGVLMSVLQSEFEYNAAEVSTNPDHSRTSVDGVG